MIYISSIANSSGQIEIGATAAHGLLTSDMTQLLGSGTADGQWVVTVVDSTHFVLQNSTYSGAGTGSGIAEHIGFAAGTIATPAASQGAALVTRLEALSATCTCRIVYEDATDAQFVTAQPLACLGSGRGAGVPFDGIYRTFTTPWASLPDSRTGWLRVKLLLAVPFSSATLSAWIA